MVPAAGGASLPVADTTAVVKGSADATKLVKIEADSLAAANRTLTIDAGAQTADRTIALPVVSANDTLAARGAANVFTKGQQIAGSADETQLSVKAHATQTANLQEWQDSGGGALARVKADNGGTFKAHVIEAGDPASSSDKFLFWAGAPANLYIASDAGLAWDSDGDVVTVATDGGVRRAAAGVLKIDDGGNGGGGVLEFSQVGSGGTPGTDAARIYAKNNGGTAELFVQDEAGNETQISPHAADSPGAEVDAGLGLPVVLKHRNAYAGIEEWIHVSALAREVERLSGKRFIFSNAIPTRNWDEDQDAKQAAYDEARAREMEALEAYEGRDGAGVAPAVREAKNIRKANPKFEARNPK
jgi:hypothetical protein